MTTLQNLRSVARKNCKGLATKIQVRAAIAEYKTDSLAKNMNMELVNHKVQCILTTPCVSKKAIQKTASIDGIRRKRTKQ
jgi:hypothetical protein